MTVNFHNQGTLTFVFVCLFWVKSSDSTSSYAHAPRAPAPHSTTKNIIQLIQSRQVPERKFLLKTVPVKTRQSHFQSPTIKSHSTHSHVKSRSRPKSVQQNVPRISRKNRKYTQSVSLKKSEKSLCKTEIEKSFKAILSFTFSQKPKAKFLI